MTNLIQKLLGSGITPVAAERTAERFRQYEYDGKGLMKQRLLPKQQDELNAKLAEAAKARDTQIDEAASKREARLREIRADYDKARAAIDAEHRQTQATANATFDEIEARLCGEYAAPLTPEQIALMTARVGEVVRVPAGNASSAPSTALPQGA